MLACVPTGRDVSLKIETHANELGATTVVLFWVPLMISFDFASYLTCLDTLYPDGNISMHMAASKISQVSLCR